MQQKNYFLHMSVISFVFLFVEVLITRLLSSLFQYHFAFLVMTLAMAGIFLSGLYYKQCKEKEGTYRKLLLALPLLIVLIPVSFMAASSMLLVANVTSSLPLSIILSIMLGLLLILLVAAIFFVLSFETIFLLGSYAKKTAKLYFANLSFSTAGCIAAIILLSVSSPYAGLFTCFVLTALLPLKEGWARIATNLKIVLFLAVIFILSIFILSALEKNSGILFEKWTPYSKVTVSASQGDACWGCAEKYAVPSDMLLIDSNAGTLIFKNASDAPVVRKDITHIGYYLLKGNASVTVIGSGGGRDVLGARTFSPRKIIAIEINPVVIEATNLFSPSIYGNNDTEVIIDDGRAGLEGLDGRQDMVQLSLVDTWAASNSGAYALVENYLYTKEALNLYTDKLSSSGLVSITRWQSEEGKLMVLGYSALTERGVADPADHLAFFSGPGKGQQRVITMLLKKQPFSGAERQKLAEVSKSLGFTVVQASKPESLSGVSDDSPFFFFNASGLGILLALLVSMVIGCLLLFRPFLKKANLDVRDTVFFSSIGLGFMFVEFLVLQKSALVLHNPTLTFGLGVGVLLAFSGIGSFLASKSGRLIRLSAGLPIIILAYIFIMDKCSSALISLGIIERVLAITALVSPLAFLMGIFFPSYFDLVKKKGASAVGFAWAANGFFSILAPVAALIISIYFGFNALAVISSAVYSIAVILLFKAYFGLGKK